MPNKEEIIQKAEKEIEVLEHELTVCKEATQMSESCKKLREFTEGVETEAEEPFSTTYTKPNAWHSNPGGGGGCIIL